MARLARRCDPDRAEAALRAIAARADAADRGCASLDRDLAALRDAGLLEALERACLPGGDTAAAVALLRRLGRVSLPVGRLVEGHLNALRLVAVYGTPDQRARVGVQGGQVAPVLGVWGADGAPPVRIAETVGSRLRLTGSKRFCSGLGIVSRAVVTAADATGAPQMVLADVRDPARADPGDWQVSGMRATLSGGFDFEGVLAEPLGAPGDFLREPHFEGGIWRYLALKTGAIEALAEAVRARIAGKPEGGGELDQARLMKAVAAAHTARMWTEAAAAAAEAPGADAGAIPLVLTARESVEGCAQEVLGIADRALGTAGFRQGCPADLLRRDLSFYLRQADLDGKLRRAARATLNHARPVGEQW